MKAKDLKQFLCNLLPTLEKETFAGRKFRGLAVFWPIRESLFREIFRTEASAKVYSYKIQERRVIFDVASKNVMKNNKETYFLFIVARKFIPAKSRKTLHPRKFIPTK